MDGARAFVTTGEGDALKEKTIYDAPGLLGAGASLWVLVDKRERVVIRLCDQPVDGKDAADTDKQNDFGVS